MTFEHDQDTASELAEAKREIDRLQRRKVHDEEFILELMTERKFLLPHATQYILERQVCIENPSINDSRDSFDALVRLIRPDLPQIVDMVVESQRVSLLQKLMGNK